jgi:hypothetical protein
MALHNDIPPGGVFDMAIKSERTISLGERLSHELCESVVYPGAEEKRLTNPTWWNTPYTRWDAEASPEENAANGAVDPASCKVGTDDSMEPVNFRNV